MLKLQKAKTKNSLNWQKKCINENLKEQKGSGKRKTLKKATSKKINKLKKAKISTKNEKQNQNKKV